MKSKLYLALIAAAAFLTAHSYADDAKKADAKPAAAKKEDKKAEKKADKKEKGDKKGKKESDADVLATQADALVAALQKSDIPTVLGYFADDFSSPMLKDKAALKAILEMGANSGSFNGLTVDKSKSKTVIDGDKATIGPSSFDASGTTGTSTIYAKKKDGSWKVSGLDLTGVSF